MLVAAALVPDTMLLVPGAGGRADVAARLRSAGLTVVGEALAALPADGGTVVVVAPGPRTQEARGRLLATLRTTGVPDALAGWAAPVVVAGEPVSAVEETQVASASVAVALHLLAQVGCSVRVRVVEVAPDDGDLDALGAALVADGPAVLVVVGSGSARHGPDAPLADDDAAPAYDAAVLADLVRADLGARARLAALDAERAYDLAVTGCAPWRVLAAAAGSSAVSARLEADEVLAGAQHAALLWRAA